MPLKRPSEDVEGISSKEKKKQRINEARSISIQSGHSTGVVTNSLSGLPSAIDVEKFVEARAFEIAAMHSARKTVESSATHRVWQTLPRSLRRRAASHDVRRVPVRLRAKAKAEMDPVKKKTLNKKISKAGMSKRITKTQQFLKRQRDKTWLETHIWHAKRMHMKNLWGYRLAETPTEKSYRPSHRAALHSSILHDASYFGTISISAKQFVLERLLSGCCDCQGANPSVVRYALGSRIQDTHLYKWHAYPLDLVAPVTIIWKPLPTDNPLQWNQSDGDAENSNKNRHSKDEKGKAGSPSLSTSKLDPSAGRTLWIRVHPAAWVEVWDTLREACSNTLEGIRKEQELNAKQNSGRDISEESIDLVDLRSRVNCFEIMGPKSSQILRGILSATDKEDRKTFHEFWSQLRDVQTPAAVPRGMVVGLKVVDPRLGFPPKHAKALIPKGKDKDTSHPTYSLMFSACPNVSLAQSELWKEVERDGGPLRPRFRKKDLDDRRRQNLVPGTPLKPEKKDDRVPLLLIQRSINSHYSNAARSTPEDSTHIHGWTLFFPAHWSMAFLESLTHTGTRVGGLRERRTQVFESASLDFPFDFPSTSAYEREAILSAQAEREEWERKPSAKRVEWESVGTRNPWKADWEIVLGLSSALDNDPDLLETQRGNENHMIVVQQAKMWLLRGNDSRKLIQSISDSSDPESELLRQLNSFRKKWRLPTLEMNPRMLFKCALVPVKLSIRGRGAPNDLAAIYSIDPVEADRIRRILMEKYKDGISENAEEKLSELIAGNDVIIGYVTTGNYSLSRGKGLAIGAIALSQLISVQLKEKQRNVHSFPLLVKVKDRKSSICRVATIQTL